MSSAEVVGPRAGRIIDRDYYFLFFFFFLVNLQRSLWEPAHHSVMATLPDPATLRTVSPTLEVSPGRRGEAEWRNDFQIELF